MSKDPNTPGRVAPETENTYGVHDDPKIGSPRRRAGGPAIRSTGRSWLTIAAVAVLVLLVLGFATGWGEGWVLGPDTTDADATPEVSADVSPADPAD